MKKYILSTFIVLAALLQVNTAMAQYKGQAYTVTNVKDLSVMAAPNDTMWLYDGVLSSVPQATTSWQGKYAFRNVRGTVALKIKKDLSSLAAIPESFTCTVVVAVRYWTTSHTGTLPAASNISLKVSYDKRKGMVYDEAALKVYENAHYISLQLVSVSNAAVKPFLQLQINMDGERNYTKTNFDIDHKPCIEKTEYIVANDEWKVTFGDELPDLYQQADEFDVEWTWIDLYDEAADQGAGEWLYNFTNNATRVILGKNERSFRIKNIFERGFVIFRFRAVSYYPETVNGEEVTLRLTGAWSANDNGRFWGAKTDIVVDVDCKIDGVQSALAIINAGSDGIAAPHLEGMNWQYISVFAEDAKNKETLGYYDGSMRARQNLATNNSDNTVLVQENIYDFNGRAAIQVLPVPVKLADNKTMTFYPDLNKYKTTSSVPYTAYHFDVDAGSTCTEATKPFDSTRTNSAAAYYSFNNPFNQTISLANWDPDKFIPVAAGFPFTQTVFTRDNTGRIATQSGVGKTHHQAAYKTKYAYETPHQEELSRLFGTDVGYKDHYKKNTVTDANGQVSVSYTDLKGHTIATALAANPTGSNHMAELEGTTPREDIVVSLINKEETQFRNDEFVYSKKIFVPETGLYKFSYSLSPQDYQPTGCPSTTPCYDCRYDLEIKLVNQCGANVLDGDVNSSGITLLKKPIGGTVNSANYSASCTTNTNYTFENDPNLNDAGGYISVSLEPGEYTITRSLKINEADYQRAEKHYMENSVCKTMQTFVDAELAMMQTNACFITCETCSTETYSGATHRTLSEFLSAKATQLGHVLSTAETKDWTEFYNECDMLSCTKRSECDVMKDIMATDMSPGGQYAAFSYNSSNVFTVSTQPFNILSTLATLPGTLLTDVDGVSTQAKTLSPENFVKYWNPEWLDYLVTLHPEYCAYTHCTSNASAYARDMDWMETDTYADAVTKGYISGTYVSSGDITPISAAYLNYQTANFDNNTPATPGNKGDDTDLRSLSPEEIALFSIFYGDLANQSLTYSEFSIMISDARSTKFSECGGAMKDTYWTMLKGMVVDLRRKALDATKTGCPSTENLANIIDRRFYAHDTEWPELDGDPVDKTPAGAQAGIADHCASQCEAYRDIWADNLKGCGLNETQMDNLLDQLEEVCRKGCDENNPMGSRTVSPANMATATHVSFEDVMRSFQVSSSNIYDYKVCSDLLLTMPKAYGHDYFSGSSPFSDTCECDGPTPPANCPCSSSSASNNPATTTVAKLLRGESAPENKCKTCYDCSATANAFYDFTTVYPLQFGVSSTYNKTETEELLVKFFNAKLGLNLVYADYQLHLAKCLGYTEVPANTDVFKLYAETYAATRTFTTKELNLVAFAPEIKIQPQFKYQYRQREPKSDYIIDYTRIAPVYASLTDGLLLTQQNAAISPGKKVDPRSLSQVLGCVCDKFNFDSALFDPPSGTYSDYFKNPDGVADANYVARLRNICRNRKEESDKCYEENKRIAALQGVDLDQYTLYYHDQEIENFLGSLGVKRCPDVDDNIHKLLEVEPMKIAFTPLGLIKFGCAGCQGDCPSDPDPVDPTHTPGDKPSLIFCQGFMPYFEDYYETYIKDDFEDGWIDKMDLISYLADETLFDNTKYDDLVSFLVGKSVIAPPGGASRQNVLNRLWETLKLCRAVSCEKFMTIATDYDATYYSSLPDGLRALAENASSLSIYTDFRNLLNRDMNKPPYLVFFDDEIVVKHFASCAKNPCDVVTEELADAKAANPSLFTEATNAIMLRKHYTTSMMSTFLADVNARIKRAPYFKQFNKNELIAAVEMCVSCSDPAYDTAPIQGVLDELAAKPGTSLFPLLHKSGWNLANDAPNLTSLFFGRNAYRNNINYMMLESALDNSFLYAEARAITGNYFYVKMATIQDNSNPSAPFDYIPALPRHDFAFIRITGFNVIRVVRFSQLEVQVIAEGLYGSGDKQSLLITLPAYAFYKNYIADQDCKHNDEVCNKPAMSFTIEVNEDPCITRLKLVARANAWHKYQTYIAGLKAAFRKGYVDKCMDRASNRLNEQFNMKYNQRQYQYTLYYYDQAGNLVKTVPPAGLAPLNSTNTATADTKRDANQPYSTTLSQHTKATTYLYNSLNQLEEQQTPDAGRSQFWYDIAGRLILSQNAKQYALDHDRYSYTFYDGLGRITEVGEIDEMSLYFTREILRSVSDFKSWIGSSSTRSQITRTYYDAYTASYSAGPPVMISTDFKNLRGRVVHSATYETDASVVPLSAVHYSYDIHGNVSSLYRETPALKKLGQDRKTVNYYYDLVSGKVNRVAYQETQPDQYLHDYRYDAENRLVNVKTGPHNFMTEDDANYYYYKHGPLARMEYGEHDVQGLDYTYTIQGWLKSVNAPTLDHTRDPGRDGYASNTANRYNGRDAFGFELSYFAGDYAAAYDFSVITNQAVTTVPAGAVINDNDIAPNLYNGNIRYMNTGLKGFTPLLSAYRYDQLNRIVQARYFNDLNTTTNTWGTGGPIDAYANTFTYDADGNIKTQVRNGKAGSEAMDDLQYYYTSGTNKLAYVSDSKAAGLYPDDIDNQASGNYSYDAAGNLVADAAEEIAEIKWNVYGKITNIIRRAGSHKPDLAFGYTPDGHRAVKTVIPKNNMQPSSTYYMRDAQGNVLATYTLNTDKVLDYESLTYNEVNNKLESLTSPAVFAEFIAQLHTTHINNASFDDPLHGLFISDAMNLESRLSEMNPEAVLSSSAVYANWLLKRINRQDVSDNLLGGNLNMSYDACVCTAGSPISLPALIMAKPAVARAFFEALCEYDNNYSTTYATDVLNSIYSGVSCPLGWSVLSDIETDLDQMNDNVHSNHNNFMTQLSGTGMDCNVINEVMYYMEQNSNTEFLALLDAIPTHTMLARWEDFNACSGGFDILGMLGGGFRESFLKALYRSDASLFANVVAQAGFTYTTGTNGVIDLMGRSSNDLMLDMNAQGINVSTNEFKNALMYLYINDPGTFNAMLTLYGVVTPNISCATSSAYSCSDAGTMQYAPGILSAAGGNAATWAHLLAGLNTPVNYANIMKVQDKYSYLQVVARYYWSSLYSFQESTNLYGGTGNGMAAYFNYIRALLGESYYTQLVNHFIQSDYLYTDSLKLEEWMLYGSSRLGSHRVNKAIAAITYTGNYEDVNLVYEAPEPTLMTDFILVRGNKRYELSNHLGNVLAVVSDKKVPIYTANPLHDGDFSSDEEGWTGGWSAAGSGWPGLTTPYTTAVMESGRLKVTATQGYGGARLLINTTPGKVYTFTFTLDKGTVPSFQFGARTAATATTYTGTNPYWSTTSSSLSNYSYSFTATTALTQLLFEKLGDAGTSRVFYLDDTKVVEEGSDLFSHYEAEVMQVTDYAPFGAPLPGRTYNAMEDMNKVVVVEGTPALTGWSTPNSSTSVSNDAVKVTFATTNTGVVEMNKTLSTTAGKHYRISFNANTATYTNVSIEIVGYGGNALSSATLNTGVTHYQLDFTANDASTVVKVSLGTGTGTRTIYIDNVKLEELKGSLKGYSAGYNGKDRDNDIYGEGSAYDFGARILSVRLGKWMSADPLEAKYPDLSPFSFAGNSPIVFKDSDGKKFINPYEDGYNKAVAALAKANESYLKAIAGRQDLTPRQIKKIQKQTGVTSAQEELDRISVDYERVQSFLHTMKIILGEKEYEYYDKLTDKAGNEVRIIINNDWNYSPDGPENSAKTIIDARTTQVLDGKTMKETSLEINGVVNNNIPVTLFRNATTQSLANELGDIKYFFTKVNDRASFDLWNRTKNLNYSEDEYRNNPDGAGKFSFDYDRSYRGAFDKHIKDNKLKPGDDYDTHDLTLKQTK